MKFALLLGITVTLNSRDGSKLGPYNLASEIAFLRMRDSDSTE